MEKKEKLLFDLEYRIKQVMLMCDSLRSENERLKRDAKKTQLELKTALNNLEEQKTKYDNLKMVRTITATSVDVGVAKNKLSKLMREVDKCINLLKE